MKKIFFVSLLAIAGCGYDGGYRYECQDPENWEAEECNPPLCHATGNCTETLLGFDPSTGVSTPAQEPDTTEESTILEPLETVDPTEETTAP